MPALTTASPNIRTILCITSTEMDLSDDMRSVLLIDIKRFCSAARNPGISTVAYVPALHRTLILPTSERKVSESGGPRISSIGSGCYDLGHVRVVETIYVCHGALAFDHNDD